jgi:very-short-patch-repair endonuclease
VIGQTNKKICSGKLNRVLRKNMSDAEQALWNVLRDRQVLGHKFRRQHPFSDYILDFVCLENKLVIEVDGGQHGQQAGYDENRTQELQAAGFCVLRFWNNEVLKEIESVKEKIGLVVQELQSHPPPNLPLEGGGVKKVAPNIPSPSRGGLGRGWGR